MRSSKLQVYDPPMCCSSGVCGPNINPELVRFSSDLDWLRQQGVEVERYNLSSNPGAFAQQEAVREALENEGNECLPLIVVDGLIVSKGICPTRSDLMRLSGNDSEKGRTEATSAKASPMESENETAVCGPGCSCGTPSGSARMKTVVSLIVLLAVGGIVAYKATSAKENASNNSAAKSEATFTVAQTTGKAASEGAFQLTGAAEQKKVEKGPIPESATMAANAATTQSSDGGKRIGESLESLSDLSIVAITEDAVLIFVPAKTDERAAEKTSAAVFAAQRTLKRSNITLGLYTLTASSPDYSAISKQVQTPAILVASKGKGMAAVSGDVTETKLLQAFVSSSSAGGCGPSGCGPSSAGCN